MALIKSSIKTNPFLLSLLGLILWAAASSFWATDANLVWTGALWRGTGLYFYISLFCGLILLNGTQGSKEILQKTYVYLASIIALATSIETLFYTRSGSTLFTGNQNATAFLLTTSLFFLLKNKLSSYKFFNFFIGIVITVGIISSGSRAALGGLILCLSIYFLYLKRPALKTLLIWGLGSLGMGALYHLFIDSNFLNGLLNRSNAFHRLDIWKGSIEAFMEKPILGWGFQGLYDGFWSHFPAGLTMDIQWVDNAHSLPFNLLTELGSIGFLLGASSVLFLLKELKDKKSDERIFWGLYIFFCFLYLFSQPVYIDTLVILFISYYLFSDSLKNFEMPKALNIPLKVSAIVVILFISVKQVQQNSLVTEARDSLDLKRDFRPYWRAFTSQKPFIDPQGSLYRLSNRFKDYYSDPLTPEGDKKIFSNLMLAEISKAYSSSSHRPRFLDTYGVWNMRAKNFKLADQNFDLILKRSPDNINIIYLKAESAALQNNKSEALTLFEKAESLNKTNTNIKMNLAKLYMSLGYRDKAISKIKEASQLDPENQDLKKILNQF